MAAKVSIITALYNHAPFVAQAIDSVLAQTYDDWELIIWDDGSTDGGLDVVRSYVRRFPQKVFSYQHEGRGNKGQEATRNEALRVAGGQYICLLDSDDYWLPRKLELQVAAVEANPRVGLVYAPTQALLHDDGLVLNLSSKEPLPQGKVFDQLVRSCFIHACSALFRRECIKGVSAPFRTQYGCIGEYPLWLAIARDWELATVPEPVAVWRVHGGNTSSRKRVQARRELVAMAEELAGDPAYGAHKPAIEAALAQYRYDLGVILVEEGSGEGALAEAQALFQGLPGRKARFMGFVAGLGPGAAHALAFFKRILFMIRDPRRAALVSAVTRSRSV